MGTGYGTNLLSGAAAGDLSAYVKSISGGGLTVAFEDEMLLKDTNKVATTYPINKRGKSLTVVMKWSPTAYNILHAQALAETKDTWTATVDGETFIGAGYVEDPGDADAGAKLGEFTAIIRPETYFAAAAV